MYMLYNGIVKIFTQKNGIEQFFLGFIVNSQEFMLHTVYVPVNMWPEYWIE